MVRIRLRRAGGKGQPTHRIVAADKESPRDGRFIEILGDYNPRTEPSTIRIKEDRVYYWLSVGAQPSDSVLQIFRIVGLLERYQRYKDGEDIEVLLAEGKQIEKERNVDPRTRRDDLVKISKPKKKTKPAEEETPEPVAEVVEEQVEEEPEAPAAEVAPEPEPAVVEADVQPEIETPDEKVEPEDVIPEVEVEPEPEPQDEEVIEEKVEVEETSEEEPVAEVEEEQVIAEEVTPQEEEKVEPAKAVDVKITPAAKKLAEEAGIDLATVKGTGKDGTILKSDISKLIKD